jgi:carbonic anhydrase
MILKPCKALLVMLVAASGLSRSSFAQNPSNWSYGAFNGPAYWAQEFPTSSCGAATGQSPIPIPNIQPTTLPKIEFGYNSATFLVENINYATEILAPTASGSPTNSITLKGDTYNLVQIHFHFPAEHTLPGVQNAVMETHFVHQDANNNILVIAVLAIIGDPTNQYVGSIWKNRPTSYGGHGSVTINPKMLLPEEGNNSDKLNYYTYQGSLTTPPCSAGVTWLVLQKQIKVTEDWLKAATCNTFPNARPIQNQSPAPTVELSNF